MQKRSMGRVNCDHCGIEFEKPVSEISRNRQLGRRNFCSRSCTGKANVGNIGHRSDYDISKHSGNARDQYTGLRQFIRRIKNRNKESNMTLEYLKELWDTQEGKCPYSGIQLVLPNNSVNDPIITASLDRIDSAKGYVVDNVQFISTAINYMKGTMSHIKTLELCQLIADNFNRRM